ncbi:oligosaccharyl transferase subunit beta [Teratosphaeria nubilosa]|uniref:Dolichyl-diphosphooligosaccharide--protein glycosyltransferase subunit WBP1 n=1 Tax=Teratosphaeria nubilosa TaxID=161662 RepID=A0A6G1L668_9PEZI|nr:oligosaccharyl transferase subunit beta [Teratosphaeria nubilosa]
MQLRILGLLLGLLSFVSALSAQGNKLLVVVEDEADKSKYSQFWLDLENRGFQITYTPIKDSALSLFQHGVPAYSHLLLLPTKAKGLGPNLAPNVLVDFVNQGSNVLLALSGAEAVPTAINSLLLELDISIPPERNSLVVDHFNYDAKSASEAHDVLLLPSPQGKKGQKNYFAVDGLVAFPRAVGQVLGNGSPLLASVIKASNTAYTYNPKDEMEGLEDIFASGSQISLVTAFQARNSARFTVLGSAEALEDKWFDATVSLSGPGKQASKAANKAFAQKLSQWAFKELGVLKAGPVKHALIQEGTGKGHIKNTTAMELGQAYGQIYRIKNDVKYSIELSEWDGDHWAPFTPPEGDAVQLEFSMLSPFHRLDLSPIGQTSEATIFGTEFKIPDQHGIFNFYVEYRRPFLTNIEEKRTVTIRHFAHDEWPRSFVISGAYPWISGIWVTISGWVVFVAVWLYSKPAQPKQYLKAPSGKR